MRLYIDTEFSNFNVQKGQLISIAAVDENDRLFYGEFTDVKWENASDWVNLNIPKTLNKDEDPELKACDITWVKGNEGQLRTQFTRWLLEYDELECWTEVGQFDWVYIANWLAVEFEANLYDWSTASGIPFPIAYFDINQLELDREALIGNLKANTKRAEFCEKLSLFDPDQRHVAWRDALYIREVVEFAKK